MKPLQVIHTIVTLVLLVVVLSFTLLTLTGIVQVRLSGREEASERLGPERDGRFPVKSAGVKARLVVVRGARPGVEYPIFEGQNIIGRADEQPVEIDLELQESPDRIWSSRQHALIRCDHGALVIEDLNSSNGTYVNRSRVPPGKKQMLKGDDIIQIGEVQFKVLL